MATSNPKIHQVRNGKLYTYDDQLVCAVATSKRQRTGWFDWLADDRNKSFAFVGQNGHFTAVKQWHKQRSGSVLAYWYAHLKRGRKLHKKSLGSVLQRQKIMLERLEFIAGELAQAGLKEAPIDEGDKAEWHEATKTVRVRHEPQGRTLPVESKDVGQLGLWD
ncbi:MAG: hypothetical protein AAF485_02000 [Chloroflexota bacterium]